MPGTSRKRIVCALVIAVAACGYAAAQAPAMDARSLVAEADKLRFSEDWYPAIDDYLAALAKNPYFGEAYSGLAECYYQLGEYDPALS